VFSVDAKVNVGMEDEARIANGFRHLNEDVYISPDLSVIHMKEHHSIRVYFWCESDAAIRYLYELLKFKQKHLSKILDQLFTILYRASENQSVGCLALNLELLNEESTEAFVKSINWDEDDFDEHFGLRGKNFMYHIRLIS